MIIDGSIYPLFFLFKLMPGWKLWSRLPMGTSTTYCSVTTYTAQNVCLVLLVRWCGWILTSLYNCLASSKFYILPLLSSCSSMLLPLNLKKTSVVETVLHHRPVFIIFWVLASTLIVLVLVSLFWHSDWFHLFPIESCWNRFVQVHPFMCPCLIYGMFCLVFQSVLR